MGTAGEKQARAPKRENSMKSAAAKDCTTKIPTVTDNKDRLSGDNSSSSDDSPSGDNSSGSDSSEDNGSCGAKSLRDMSLAAMRKARGSDIGRRDGL